MINKQKDHVSFRTSDVLNENLPFFVNLKIAGEGQSLYDTVHRMKDFILSSSTPHIQREGMEFLYWNGFYEELHTLVHKHKANLDVNSVQWAEMYEWMYKRKKRRTKPVELIELMKNLKTSDPAIQALKFFMLIYSYYDLREYGKLGTYLEPLEKCLRQVESPLLQEYLTMRQYEALFHYHWKKNEIIMARLYGYKVINHTYNEERKAMLHSHLAHTFIFESYEKAMGHIQEALLLSKIYGYEFIHDQVANYSIPFIAAHFGKYEGITTTDLSEQAHLEIARGNRQKAIKLLEQLEVFTPFRIYYYGLAKEDIDILRKSYQSFVTEYRDYFYARLPLRAIEKLQ
ncbi:MAG: hypothetical protein H0Z32_05435 [Bacillaceae bacterium]|nr:hypothetical protein [Bacillaceae bacterium]